jgi:hypothetical protein
LLYLSKGVAFVSNYLFILILFNKIAPKEFATYSSLSYLAFIVLTILDFGFSNYVILNKEVYSNERLLVSLHRKKLGLTLVFVVGCCVTYFITGYFFYLLFSLIAFQQAFNFDGLFKIKNTYKIIIVKYFLTSTANVLVLLLLIFKSVSANAILSFVYLGGAIVNIATLPAYVRSKILFQKTIVYTGAPGKFHTSTFISLIIYFSFNFLSNFTYAFYAYGMKEHVEPAYYSSNVVVLNFISNLYVLYLIFREYCFTRSAVNNRSLYILLTFFLITGAAAIFNYNRLVSFFGRDVMIELSDRFVLAGIFITLILKSELYFRKLKSYVFLKFLTIVLLASNLLLLLFFTKFVHLYNARLLLVPLFLLDVFIILCSIIGHYVNKRITGVSSRRLFLARILSKKAASY